MPISMEIIYTFQAINDKFHCKDICAERTQVKKYCDVNNRFL